MTSIEAVPELFSGAIDYKFDPEALESAQRTFNEEGLYVAIEHMAAAWYVRYGRPPRVLDLCSATGLTAWRVSAVVPAATITLVDNEPTALAKAAENFAGRADVAIVCDDAVTYRDGTAYDLILMNSAYHHIENGRKAAFLENAAELLSADGCVLVGEHFLPPYVDDETFRRAVVDFYARLLDELERCGEPKRAIAVIRQSAYYTWLGEYEYKTSWDFARRCIPASLTVHEVDPVWLPDARAQTIGTMALRLETNGL